MQHIPMFCGRIKPPDASQRLDQLGCIAIPSQRFGDGGIGPTTHITVSRVSRHEMEQRFQ